MGLAHGYDGLPQHTEYPSIIRKAFTTATLRYDVSTPPDVSPAIAVPSHSRRSVSRKLHCRSCLQTAPMESRHPHSIHTSRSGSDRLQPRKQFGHLAVLVCEPVGGPDAVEQPAKALQNFLPQAIPVAHRYAGVTRCAIALNTGDEAIPLARMPYADINSKAMHADLGHRLRSLLAEVVCNMHFKVAISVEKPLLCGCKPLRRASMTSAQSRSQPTATPLFLSEWDQIAAEHGSIALRLLSPTVR